MDMVMRYTKITEQLMRKHKEVMVCRMQEKAVPVLMGKTIMMVLPFVMDQRVLVKLINLRTVR